MALYEIKHLITGGVLFSLECDSLKLCVEAAVKAGASLDGASLDGASLNGASLDGAEIRDGITITRRPLQLYGLRWPVTIFDRHMQIGCEFHALSEWAAFDDRRIADMEDGREALKFWRAHKDTLLGLARADGRGVEAQTEAA